jgi:pimeloyl-ACP methyl ester carboxylesterase
MDRAMPARSRFATSARAQAARLPRFEPFGPRPDPSDADGPDPYGNPNPEWLAIDWRSLLDDVDIGGERIHYVESGPIEPEDAPPILLVHGLSGCWQNWLENIPHLARRHRVVALDLPGFGSSPMPAGWDISIPNYGKLVTDFCEEIGLDEAIIVGHSMGGFVAAEAVINDPGRFERLGLISAAGVSSARLRREPTEVFARMATAGTPLVIGLQTRSFRRPRARSLAFKGLVKHPELLRPELLWEFFDGGTRGDGFADALTSLAGYDILDRLEEVELQALIVWGRNDYVVPPADAAQYARRLRNSKTVIFNDCGHLVQAEHPVRFNRLLDGFLA